MAGLLLANSRDPTEQFVRGYTIGRHDVAEWRNGAGQYAYFLIDARGDKWRPWGAQVDEQYMTSAWVAQFSSIPIT